MESEISSSRQDISFLIEVIAVIWTGVIVFSLVWNWHQIGKSAERFAISEARASFNKDLIFRRWASLHGGFYMRPTAAMPANPYLSHIPDRDIVTTSGEQLTLINPAYMTRKVHALAKEQNGIQGHITSLNPLNPINTADQWEASVLESFKTGNEEIISKEKIDGESYLRLMRPFVTEKSCLKCHASQGYKEGDIRGGLSVSVPFHPFAMAAKKHRLVLLFAHLLIGYLGFLGLWKGNQLLRSSRKALLTSDERNRTILRTAMDGFLVLDSTGWILEANQTYSEMSGYSVEELLSMQLSDLRDIDFVEKTSEVLDKVMTVGDDRYEAVHRRKDGTTFDIEVSIQYGATLEGHFVLFLRDISERKQSEKDRKYLQTQLQQSQKMEAIGTLAGGIAHDFNNILGAILGYTEMAKLEVAKNSQVMTDLDQVLLAGNRAKDLVKRILAFSRQGETELIPLEPAVIIKESLKLLRSSIPTTIEIKEEIEFAGGFILADQTHIHQILMNLCTNAFHAMEKTGGVITVSLHRKEVSADELLKYPDVQAGSFMQLSVVDDGPGIASAIQEMIFDPYFTTKEVGKGTGLGLSLVHGIVKSFGGFITCESRLGEGTAFRICIPELTQELEAEAISEQIDVYPAGNEHILYVDDEEMLADMGKIMLERLGYRVTVRSCSHEALDAFRKQPEDFDLIITDQTMPGLTGTDLAEKVLKLRPEIPIILCTGYSSLVSEESIRLLGIKALVMKPLATNEIAVLLRELLDGQRN